MKKIYFLLSLLCLAIAAKSQNVANYSFATTTTGSLADMSSGTLPLVQGDQNDSTSAVTDIGFDFFFQGNRYAQFSVNTNGALQLGATAVANILYNPLGGSGQALITAYGANQRSHAGDGKVHYKVSGTAPGRKLTVEWRNMQSDLNAGGTADLTYQVNLYETSGVIEFVYGNMSLSAAGATDVNSASPQIGFSSGNTVGTVGALTAAQSGTPAPTYNSGSATPVDNVYTAGTIPVLTSAADGSRRTFSFTPVIPTAPSGLSFTGVTLTGMTLNWTDNATNEVAYAIYRSTDGINYSLLNQIAANSVTFTPTDIQENTSYSWKVYAVSEGGLSAALSGTQATPAAAVITSNGTGGGLWSAASTWTGGVIPGFNDNVTIKDGDTVTIDGADSAYNLNIGEGVSGVLQFDANIPRTLMVYNNVTVAAGGLFQSATTGLALHSLSLSGNLINNGTLDFSTASDAAGTNITFTGAGNSTFSGSGPLTDIRILTLNKGTSNASVLELNPANFSVRGSVTDNATAGFLILSNGMFKISGNFTYTGRIFSTTGYTIGATTGLWLNNPNFTIAAQSGNVVNSGIMRLSNGTWNIGTTAALTVTGTAGASYIIEGGTFNVSGRMNSIAATSYTQSGGVVNLATVGNSGTGTNNATFVLTSTAAAFNMSGGSINLVQACTGASTPTDWNVSTSNFLCTGGVLNIGTGATSTNFNFRIRSYIPNLVIDNTTNNKTATAQGQLNLMGNTTINAGATLVINNQVCLIKGSLFTNNGTLSGTGSSTRFYFLGGFGPATYAGSGTVTAPLASFEIDNAAGVTIDPSVNQISVLRFNALNGGLTHANKLTLGNGGATTATIQLGVSGVVSPISGFDVPPVFNPGTGGVNLIYAPELTSRTTGPEVPPSRIVNLVNVSNPNGIIIGGGDITTSSLTMSSGNIATGSNTLILGTGPAATGTYTYTSGTIVGKFKRWIGIATGNYDFPVGVATAKRNVSVNFTTAPTAGGSLTAQWISGIGGANGLPLVQDALNITGTSNDGYWRITAGDGLTDGVYTGTFMATGISDVTDVTQLVLVKRADSLSPWTLNGTHVTGSGTTLAPVISRTGMSGFSEFGIGGSFIVLPVDLLSFSGEQTGDVNQLRWTTAQEENNRGFEVQRSLNGLDYMTLGFVDSRAAGGNSSTMLEYHFTDGHPSGAVQYYRLRQVDKDNRSKYSNVILIKGKKPALLNISGLFPNPATNEITILVASPARSILTVSIADINGKIIGQRNAAIEAGSNSLPLDVRQLPAGSYLVRLSSENGSAVTRFVKQ